MQKPLSRAKQNIRRVEALFEAIRQAIPGVDKSRWLNALEWDAKNVRPGWRERFDAWLLGQEQAGGVPVARATQWRREADACLSKTFRLEPVVFCVLWTLLVTLTTLAWQSNMVSRTQALAGCAVIALTGVTWVERLGWLAGRGRAPFRRWQYVFKLAAAGAGAVAVGVIAPGLFSELGKLGAYLAFEHQQKAFATVPSGFPWIRDFARREFGVDVVMTVPQQAWARTTLHVVGSSPAIMSTGNDLCELSISREGIVNGFAVPPGRAIDPWVHGIMMHELAHCLDVRRDYAGQGGAWSSSRSIAPADRQGVQNGPGHYKIAAESVTTQLWREALADMMAVGYWRLNSVVSDKNTMTATLRDKRLASREDDAVHATMCWIDLAASAPGPSSNRELFAWADKLRSASTCNVVSR